MCLLEKRKYNAKLKKCWCTRKDVAFPISHAIAQCTPEESKAVFEIRPEVHFWTNLLVVPIHYALVHSTEWSKSTFDKHFWMQLSQMCSRTVPNALQQLTGSLQVPDQAQTSPKQTLSDTSLGTNRFAPLISYHPVLPATVRITSVTSTNFAIWKEVDVNKNTAVDFRTD